MKLASITLMFLLVGSLAPAQSIQRCATESYHEEMLQKDRDYAASYANSQRQFIDYEKNHPSVNPQGIINIPVVFHVIYNTAAQNISTARILENLNVLNQDFNRLNPDTANTPAVFQTCAANVGINFCLATQDPNGLSTTGILSVPTTVSSFTTNNNVKSTATGGDDAWPSNHYLNIWVCNLSSGILGFSTLPGGPAATDGIVVHYESVGGPNLPGTNPPFNLGRNLTHEAGHYLNLLHFNINCNPISSFCAPPQQSQHFGCPVFPHITCNNGPNGDMFMNFMQFVDDDCMNLFTAGQATRMIQTMTSTRVSLTSSVGCDPVGLNEINPSNEFNIMPNPFSDFINIETRNSNEVELLMIDLSGRIVLSKHFTHRISLNTHSLAKGFYYIELMMGHKKELQKVIKN